MQIYIFMFVHISIFMSLYLYICIHPLWVYVIIILPVKIHTQMLCIYVCTHMHMFLVIIPVRLGSDSWTRPVSTCCEDNVCCQQDTCHVGKIPHVINFIFENPWQITYSQHLYFPFVMTTEFQTWSLKESRRPQHFNVMCFASLKNVMVFCDSSYNGIFDETNIVSWWHEKVTSWIHQYNWNVIFTLES